jgi:hypothetical protein
MAAATRRKARDFQIYTKPVPESDKLVLAGRLLFGLAVLMLLGGLAYYFNEKTGEKIFSTCTTTIPPIVTLILGYYFSKQK